MFIWIYYFLCDSIHSKESTKEPEAVLASTLLEINISYKAKQNFVFLYKMNLKLQLEILSIFNSHRPPDITVYSPDNLTLANSHHPDNSHDGPRHNFP